MKIIKKILTQVLLVAGIVCLYQATWAETAATAINPSTAGWGFIGAAIAAGLSSFAAGLAVAHVGSAAVGAITEKPELAGRTLIYVGLAEGIAIYGLIIAIMILGKV